VKPSFESNRGLSMKTARAAGFTILEIMIATAILTLGLVEKSTASVVAESVAEAIREGLRNNLRTNFAGGATNHFFIFKHDGVTDPIPNRKEHELPDKDFYILLPRFRPLKEGIFSSREAAQRIAKTFVYPETDPNPNGGGDPDKADDDGDDYQAHLSTGETTNSAFIQKTYAVGDFLPGDNPSVTGEDVLEDQKIDAVKQYSYAFEIQSSLGDANLDWSGKRFQPANRLYRVRVYIFRGFPKAQEGRLVELSVPATPVFELDFEVSI
jgi:type II secretory pathway pseudopilin PulG